MLGLRNSLLICRRADVVRTVESLYCKQIVCFSWSAFFVNRVAVLGGLGALSCTSRGQAAPKIPRTISSNSHASLYANTAVAVAPWLWFPDWCRRCSSCHCARSRASAALKVSPWCSQSVKYTYRQQVRILKPLSVCRCGVP
jgi:hypothetical protein